MKNFQWTTKDFVWTIIILVSIIITILTVRLADNTDVVAYISFGSTLVSVALALVAMGISVVQNNSSQDLNNRMNNSLARMDEKLQSVQDKVNTLDFDSIKSKINESIDNSIEGIYEKIDNKGGEIPKEDIKRIIKEELHKEAEYLNTEIAETVKKKVETINNNIYDDNSVKNFKAQTKATDLMIGYMKRGGKEHYFLDELCNHILVDHRVAIGRSRIRKILDDLIKMGIVDYDVIEGRKGYKVSSQYIKL